MTVQDFQLGLRNSRIVHITEVESGLRCNCYCPCCGGKFVAYKGKILRPHFKHQVESNCNYSFETSLHYLAKEIIQEKRYLDLPMVNWTIPNTPFSWFAENSVPPFETVEFQRVYFDKVDVEKSESDFKPDLRCYVGDKQLLIEITVTHGIDEKKLRKIKNNDVPLLEINLSSLEHTITKKTLTKALYHKKASSPEPKNFKWIYNPRNDRVHGAQFERSGRIFEFLKNNRKYIKLYGKNKEVYNCPLQQKHKAPHKYADVCEYCIYNLGKIDIAAKQAEYSNLIDKAVMCIGHKKYELDVLLKECGVKNCIHIP
jgi:hypothetical protein